MNTQALKSKRAGEGERVYCTFKTFTKKRMKNINMYKSKHKGGCTFR